MTCGQAQCDIKEIYTIKAKLDYSRLYSAIVPYVPREITTLRPLFCFFSWGQDGTQNLEPFLSSQLRLPYQVLDFLSLEVFLLKNLPTHAKNSATCQLCQGSSRCQSLTAGWRPSVSNFSETGFAANWKSLQESPLLLVPSLKRSGAKGDSLYKPKVLTLSVFRSGRGHSFYHSHAPSVRLFCFKTYDQIMTLYKI